MPGTPSLAGQHGFYAITQLFLFREGRRSNEAMTAVAKTMKDDDMRGFAAVIDALPAVPPAPPATPPDPARMNKARDLARQHKCVFCHGDDLSGGQQVPRIGGQREEYMRETLRGFKSGQRPGYTQAMTEAVSQVSVEELDLLAYYAARVPVTRWRRRGRECAASSAAPEALNAQRARSSACSVRIRLAIEASKNSRLSASSPANSRRAAPRSIAFCTSSSATRRRSSRAGR